MSEQPVISRQARRAEEREVARVGAMVNDLEQYEQATAQLAADDEMRANGAIGLPPEDRVRITALRNMHVNRIRACLNACHGMPTETLVDAGVGCVRDTIDQLNSEIIKAKGEKRIIRPGEG